MVKENVVAEDISQEVFSKMYREIQKLENDQLFTAWFLRLARNYTIDYMRKYKNEGRVIKNSCYEIDKLNGIQENLDFLYYLEVLNDEEADILIKRIVYGYTFKRISEDDNIHISKVVVIYTKALSKIREIYNA